MRDREMERVTAQNPDLSERVAAWRTEHPSGTLDEAVRDLELWNRPGDLDAQWLIWTALRDQEDPAAMSGFPAMRAAATHKLGTPATPAAPGTDPLTGSAR